MISAIPTRAASASEPVHIPLRSRLLQRKCACGGTPGPSGECAECSQKKLRRKGADGVAKRIGHPAPAMVNDVLRSPGQPLDAATRAFAEPRFGHDFSQVPMYAGRPAGMTSSLTIGDPRDGFEQEADATARRAVSGGLAAGGARRDFGGVRVHTDAMAAESARAVDALAYTVGPHIVFGAGQYAPGTSEGRQLLAHELTHVVQQGASPASGGLVQRQPAIPTPGDDADLAAEREFGGSGAPKAQKCGRPSWCPAGFCDPYSSQKLAEYYRAKNSWWLMAGISAVVDSRVVPLWREYLMGGSPPKNLSADFGKDFTASPTTKTTTGFLHDALKKQIASNPPPLPLNDDVVLDLKTLIPAAIAALTDDTSPDQMNFNIPKDIPGNLAGGLGKDQTACPSGAQPSPFNDDRRASGEVLVVRTSPTALLVLPVIDYTVKDTIDLCPGDCGTAAEQIATVPLSQFEASGISGDVPFTVDFPAPFLGPFTILAQVPAAAAAPAAPKASPKPPAHATPGTPTPAQVPKQP